MPTTPTYGLRYPSLADAPNGPDAVQDLAEDVEATLGSIAPVSAVTINAKGDLLAGTANDTVSRLAVGADGEVLTADSGSPTGLTWATPATVAAASASVVTSESTTTDSFVDLTTPGPAVTVAVGPQGVAVVSVTAITGSSYQEDTDVWFEGQAGFAVTGANTIAASSPKSLGVDVRALTAGGDAWVTSSVRGSATFVLTGLAPGSTTFTMKYRCSDIGGGGGSASFSNRQIGVVTF